MERAIRRTPQALDIFILFAIIMAALFTGVVTATEAAALSCSVALVIVIARKKMTWKGFSASIIDTLRLSTIIFMIIAGATIFGRFLALTRLPYEAADVISSLNAPRPLLLALVLLCYIIADASWTRSRFCSYLFRSSSARFGDGIRSRLVRTGDHDRHHHGIDHAADRNMLLRGARMAKDIPLTTGFRGALWYIPAYIIALVIIILFPHGPSRYYPTS
jgi:TRAP-type C4-dicarboxylate transport system permease large subunit